MIPDSKIIILWFSASHNALKDATVTFKLLDSIHKKISLPLWRQRLRGDCLRFDVWQTVYHDGRKNLLKITHDVSLHNLRSNVIDESFLRELCIIELGMVYQECEWDTNLVDRVQAVECLFAAAILHVRVYFVGILLHCLSSVDLRAYRIRSPSWKSHMSSGILNTVGSRLLFSFATSLADCVCVVVIVRYWITSYVFHDSSHLFSWVLGSKLKSVLDFEWSEAGVYVFRAFLSK